MNIDLLAGAAIRTVARPCPQRPTVLVFDSGLGGLTVYREIVRAAPDAAYVYAADDAAFPVGDWPEDALTERTVAVMERLLDHARPDIAVIACNTLSTLVLPALRARFDVPFVGTVPAVKPAAASSRSGRIAVLATPGTIRRGYTRGLVEAYAGPCQVDLVGSTRLAGYAEAELAGSPVADRLISEELAPCFRADDGCSTDAVVLACTHYPLLLDRFRALAPWPVAWINPAPAIARRVVDLAVPRDRRGTGPPAGDGLAIFTGAAGPAGPARDLLRGFGLPRLLTGVAPLA